ncbi:hypothetical protein [Bacillus paranthracis]|nr:hypothetical protein [Bacillus paranthracis]
MATVLGHKIAKKKGQVVMNLHIDDIPSHDLVGSKVYILVELTPMSFRRAGSGYMELVCDFNEDGIRYKRSVYLDMMAGDVVQEYMGKKLPHMVEVDLVKGNEDGSKFLVSVDSQRFWVHRDRLLKMKVSNHTGTCMIYQRDYLTTDRGRWDFDRCSKK